MARITYVECRGGPKFGAAFAGLLGLLAIGAGSALYMEANGHVVTGMNNSVVWGVPHVFAIFLILAASGVLNIASLGSVFGEMRYKPKARLSSVLAITLLVGGLSVLVLDLGRPDRLTVAMTNYNFRSIFAWNVLLYSGFVAVVAAYLTVQMTRRWEKFVKPIGLAAFLWRLVLTTGTGSIFGFIVARSGLGTAVLAPEFIAMSLAYGLAVFLLIRLAIDDASDRRLSDALLGRLGRLLMIFAGSVLYFTGVYHFTGIFSPERVDFEAWILTHGGLYTAAFWIGAIVLGLLVPMAMLYGRDDPSRGTIAGASALVVLGGFAQLWVIVIGGQVFPMRLFPGFEVSSSFGDGVVATYVPSLPEIGLGLGGVAVALLLTMIALRLLRLLPHEEA
ncbi:MAG: polysulfide reductase NrfD [Phyllobacteriaceae bacterium]|nr:polysulfide reductase NrfD [Phyllobacteriaceae bacterium]